MSTSSLFVGDPHGDLDFIEHAAGLAAEHDAEMIVVGDWGFLWPSSNQLNALSIALTRAGEKFAKPPVTMRFIDGNHDWHPELRRLTFEAIFRSDGGYGFEVAPNVRYQPRGSVYEDADGTRFLFCGGAPSIDRSLRTPGRSWWPEEVISETEYRRSLSAEGPIHVLVTHDAPDYPPGFMPKGDPDFRERSCRSMEMVRGLIDHHQPELHVHGHWHTRATTRRGNTRIECLNCNYARFPDSVMLWSR